MLRSLLSVRVTRATMWVFVSLGLSKRIDSASCKSVQLGFERSIEKIVGEIWEMTKLGKKRIHL